MFLDLFKPSGEGRENPTLSGPLERIKLNDWMTTQIIYLKIDMIVEK
jgi:hypothetical protein